ncbi:MAG: metal-dependent transcriptional regulator [Candidatus Zixiibacteriota bacterium]
MPKITPNIEDYLEAILEISNKNGFARVKDIAAHLEVKNPSVTQQIQKLSGMKLVSHKSYGNVTLTDKGREIAERTLKRHKMFVKLLGEILHLPKSVSEDDACKMEHAINPRTMKRLSILIDYINEKELAEDLAAYIKEKCMLEDNC